MAYIIERKNKGNIYRYETESYWDTVSVSLSDLSKDFIPVFAKDNESTISHNWYFF